MREISLQAVVKLSLFKPPSRYSLSGSGMDNRAMRISAVLSESHTTIPLIQPLGR